MLESANSRFTLSFEMLLPAQLRLAYNLTRDVAAPSMLSISVLKVQKFCSPALRRNAFLYLTV